MSKHEHFEELGAAASIGQASGAELAELREHFAFCSECQQCFSEFLQINAQQFARNVKDSELSPGEAIALIDSTQFRERFLKKAEAEGIVFSAKDKDIDSKLPEPDIRSSSRIWAWPVMFARAAAAAVLLMSVAAGGYYLGTHNANRFVVFSTTPPTYASRQTSADQARAVAIASLEAENRTLTSEVVSLRKSLSSTSSRVAELQKTGSANGEERSLFASSVKERNETIAGLQARLDRAQGAVASIRSDLERAQSDSDRNRATLVEDQLRIRELSDQLAEKSGDLAREKDLLAAGRDIRELMAARNLHIVDVFDTDPKGKTRPAFGRIFFTEGKSLLFYAYDMPDTRLKDADYHYRIWGKKEGPNQRARNLGIFFSDDKVQKRWVFQFDDPKILNEIDSVFVTLEPPNSSPTQPQGDKLLYAYLKGQANHP